MILYVRNFSIIIYEKEPFLLTSTCIYFFYYIKLKISVDRDLK